METEKTPQAGNNTTLNTVVGFIPYNWEHAVTLLRIVRPLERTGVRVIHGSVLPKNVSLGDVIVIQRELPYKMTLYEQITARARAEGKAIIYEIDDLLLELPGDHPATDYYTPGLFSILRAVIEADLVTTTTPALQDYLRPFNPMTYVLPNYLDDQIWMPPPAREVQDHSPVVVGYMGSKTHQADLALVTPALAHLLDHHGQDIQLRFWGEEPPNSLRQHSNVTWVPLEMRNYAEFAAYFSQQECDLFIAPLTASSFNRCKSAIKYLEYSSQAIPGVYSRITPYENVITNGENGFLAATLDEWGFCLTQLIENPELRREMGTKAQQHVNEHWLLSQHAHKWREVYQLAQKISADEDAQQVKQEYIQVFVRVAVQVRDWQDKLRQQLIEKEGETQKLQARLNESRAFQREIERSTAWRIAQKVRRLGTRLFPPGS